MQFWDSAVDHRGGGDTTLGSNCLRGNPSFDCSDAEAQRAQLVVVIHRRERWAEIFQQYSDAVVLQQSLTNRPRGLEH